LISQSRGLGDVYKRQDLLGLATRANTSNVKAKT
jgi:hypothetical protein